MTLYPTDKPVLALRLKQVRASKNLTAKQMSKFVGVSETNYLRYERKDSKYFPLEDIVLNMLRFFGSDTFNYVFGLSNKCADVAPLLEYPINRTLLADRIKEVRLSKNLSNQQMASLLGVTDRNCRRYQQGIRFPSYESVVAISKKIEPQIFEYIFGMTDEKPVGVR